MAITTNFKNYATAHGKGEGGGGGTTIIMGNINNTDLPDDINVGSITAENGNIDYLNGKSLSYNDGGFIYISANDGTIAKLRGDEISYKDGVISRLQSDEITTGKLKADEAEIDKATINTINSKNITTEYLTVTKQAHFFELIVDKIRSVGGTTIQTAANCIIDWVKAYDSNDNEVALDANNVAYYNVYWRATEPSGRQITNDWRPFDQAICQSFNNVSAGVNYDISNKYYWRLVTALLPDTYMNINTGATTTQANAGVNSVQITNRTITYKDYQDQDQTLVNKFDIVAQTIPNVQTGASWNSSTETMTTTNTVFGIQLTPQQDLDNIVPTKFSFDCSSARLSVGIYYVDSTSQYFPAPDIAQTHYEYDLNADNNIEAIIITNADEVSWHLVHGIRLSNTDKDANLSGSSSIPSKGDNIAQLGYRWNANGADANDKKRASAIIIAAYQTPDTGLTPPSYAQYQNITDYSLSSHRGTYMDANGSKFIGDFWIDNNTSIDDYIDDYINTYGPTYNLYTAYATSADYAQQRITSLTDSTGCQYMGMCSSPATTQPTNFSDYSWFVIQGSQGANGDSIMFIYNNATAITVAPTSPPPYTSIPTGWATAATTPPDHQYTWMSQATKRGIDGKYGLMGATAFNYGQWTTPVRITGDDGQPGTDGATGATGANGKYMEFIYTRNAGISGAPNPPAAPPVSGGPYPADWPRHGNVDHDTDTNGIVWYDNPQGVNGTTALFEYMSQREYDGTSFGNYTTPVVWSNWGVKGQDGDGYEYIYAVNDSDTEYPPITYTANRGKTSSDDDFVPIGWEDEPQTLSSSNKYEWVSTRKRENGGPWQNFTPPKIWAHWSDRGSQGPTGPTGPQGPAGQDGVNAIQYVLVDQGSVATVVASLDSNNNVTKQLIINLRYKVVVIEGATARYATMQEMRDFPRQAGDYDGCYAYCKMSLDQNNANYRYLKMNLNTNDTATSDALFTYTQQISNEYVINTNDVLVIALINYNAVNNQQNSISPTSANLQYTLYTTNMQITLAPSASLQIIQGDHASISTLVTGQQNQSQQISQLQQTASQISSTVSSYTTQINNINGDITNINNEISTIQQTSSSITSKVENLNTGSKNYFNYTFTQFIEGAVPYIQGYGLEVKGTASNGQRYSQVNNLDFDGKGGDFSVTCWMKMQAIAKNVLVGLCNTNPNNITANGGRVTVSTTWKKYTFTYNVTDANTNVSNANGHVTFSVSQGDSFTDTNRLYVKYLMITRGNVPCDFNVSWRDYDSVMTKEEALIVRDDMWTYKSGFNFNKTTDKFKGYDVYTCTRNTGVSDNHYIDVINVSSIPVKKNKIYTLSFYAKTNGLSINNTNEASRLGRDAYMYNHYPVYSRMGIDESSRQIDLNSPVGQPSKGNNEDGVTNYKLNNAWQQFIIHWFNQDSTQSDFIAMRLLGQQSTTTVVFEPFSIAGVELREGWWDVDGINSSSMIKQTADEIELKVKNTGINIDDGTITLNASNTTINGGLNLYGGDQGLKIYDSLGGEKISVYPDNITGLTSNIATTDDHRTKYSYNGSKGKYTTVTAYNSSGTVSFATINIGTVEQGGTVRVNQIQIKTQADTHPQVNYTWIMYVNGNQIGSGQGTMTYSPRQGYTAGGLSRYSSSAGTVTFKLTLTNATSSNQYDMQVWSETVSSSLSKIGQDGAVFAQDHNSFHWFGPDKTVISQPIGTGSRQLSIDGEGIYNNGADIGGQVNVTLLTNSNTSTTDINNVNKYDATMKDTFIVPYSNTHNVNIYLPSAFNCTGKVYYVKNMSTKTIKVYTNTGSSHMINSANVSDAAYIDVDNISYMFIAGGSFGWITFKCD